MRQLGLGARAELLELGAEETRCPSATMAKTPSCSQTPIVNGEPTLETASAT